MLLHRLAIFALLVVVPALGQVQKTHPHWSGYVATGATGSVTYAKGSWTVPPVVCDGQNNSLALFWVGIDGYLSPSVEQVGITALCVTDTTDPEYSAWYAFYPQGQVEIPLGIINAKDKIWADVSFKGESYTFTITDVNTGNSSGPINGQPRKTVDRSSAECIVEMPQVSQPLADFGGVFFGRDETGVPKTCWATLGGKTKAIGKFQDVFELTMVNKSSKAVPSPLSKDLSSFSVLQYAGVVLADMPVAYYRLGDVQGTYAVDSSGQGNNGTYENGAGLGASGLILDAANSAVDFATGDVVIPDAANLNFVGHPFAIEAWIKGTNLSTQQRVFDKIVANTSDGYGLDLASDNIRLLGCDHHLNVSVSLRDDTPYHIVGVSNGTTGFVYVNGQLAGSGPYTTCTPYTGPAHIAVASDGTAHFDGVIDEVAIYSSVLSAQRVLAHYQAATRQ